MRRQFTKLRLLIVTTLLTLSGPTVALDVHFGGFGTASFSCFDNDTADYVTNAQPEGPGRSKNCDAGLDSLLGVQLDLGFSESFEFGLQLIADRNTDRSYAPEVSIAQLRWRPTDATMIRAGRLPSVSFLHSESRQVRYAMPWVRPPSEVYGLLPHFAQDGLDVIHQSRLGEWSAEWHGGIAEIEFEQPVSDSKDTFTVEGGALFLHLSLRQRSMLLKLGYAYGGVSISNTDLEQLLNALRTFVPGGSAVADDLTTEDSASHMFVAGLSYEQNDWLVMSELGYRTLEGPFRDQLGIYATLGRRFGPWMPYATVARRWTRGPDTDSRAGFLQPQVDAILATTHFDTSSFSLGLSREINEQATLKLQADRIRPDKNSWGLYTNHAADYDYASPDSNWLVTLSVDFVF